MNQIPKTSHCRKLLLPHLLMRICAVMGVLVILTGSARTGFAQKVTPKVKIGKDTTYVTGPLTKDGYIDYIAHLNSKLSKGVTPENNAAVLLLKASPGDINDEAYLKQYCKALGIKPIPLKGDYFQNMYQFAVAEGEDDKSRKLTTKEKSELSNEFYEQQAEAAKRLWTADEFPKVKKWLDQNEKHLETVRKASLRKKYYHPLITGDSEEGLDMLVGVLLPQVQSTRSYARALASSAMLHAGEGRFEECTEDLLTMRRLSSLIAQGPTFIEQLVGVAIGGIAQNVEQEIAINGGFTSEQLLAYRGKMEKARLKINMMRSFGECERLMYLDCVQQVMRGGLKSLNAITGNSGLGGGRKQTQMQQMLDKLVSSSTDWSVTMREGNRVYDKYIEEMRTDDWQEQHQALRRMENELKDIQDLGNPTSVIRAMLAGPEYRGKMMGKIFVGLLMPALNAATTAEKRAVVMDDLSYLVITIAAHKEKNGRYPDSLQDLKGAGKLPTDRYANEDYRYVRKGDGFIVYSVGVNSKDDDGNGVYNEKMDQGDDYGAGYSTLETQEKGRTR